MKRIVFLGCENSHSATFINFIKNDPAYGDVEIAGVYSHDRSAAEKLAEKYGVPVLDDYSDAVGKVDGIVVTARHGDNHLKYALPYLCKNMVVFMDKPITVSESDALEFVRVCIKNGVKITGGSSCRFDAFVKELKSDAENKIGGETISGFVRCPMSINNVNGGLFFYAQHLVEIVGEIFGRYPKSVKSYLNGKKLTVVFRYERYDVIGLFVDESYNCYYAMRVVENDVKGSVFTVNGSNPCFKEEFDEFYRILSGEKQVADFKDFIAPVFVMNAVQRSLDSGNEEKVREISI